MPQATNLVVNNGAGTPLAKTFTLLTPASGDAGIAEWALKEGTIGSVFPRFTASARRTTNASRKLFIKFKLPSSYTDTVTGLTKVGSGFEFDGSVSVPDDFPESLKNDAVAFTSNIIAHALVKEMIRDALPAT